MSTNIDKPEQHIEEHEEEIQEEEEHLDEETQKKLKNMKIDDSAFTQDTDNKKQKTGKTGKVY